MKNKLFLFAFTVIFVLSQLMSLTGCENDNKKTEPYAIAIVAGMNHNSAPLHKNNIKKPVDDVALSRGYVCCVRLDGNPQLIAEKTFKDRTGNYTEKQLRNFLKDDAKKFISKIISQAASVYEECDLYSAILLAAKELNESGFSDRRLVIIHSGLSTSGYIDFTKEYDNKKTLFDALPQTLVDQLREHDLLAPLEGVDITFVNFAQVSDEQEPLSDECFVKFKSFWEDFLKECGAANVHFDNNKSAKKNGYDNLALPDNLVLPSVTTVKFPEDTDIIHFKGSKIVEDNKDAQGNSVKFKPESAEFKDPVSAEKVIKAIANDILNDKSNPEIIVGATTASWGDGDGISLSLERAQAVKDVLVKSGVDESKIICVGIGRNPNFSQHVEDLNKKGKFVEEKGKLNRCVYIYPASSELGKEMLNFK